MHSPQLFATKAINKLEESKKRNDWHTQGRENSLAYYNVKCLTVILARKGSKFILLLDLTLVQASREFRMRLIVHLINSKNLP